MVKGAVKLALDLGVPALVVGLTVVAITTSLPEAFASIAAQVSGHEGDVALGNVIGSNIANLSLVLGLALLMRPLTVPNVIKTREMPFVVVVTVLLFLMMIPGVIGWVKGVIFIVGMVGYTLYQLKIAKMEESIAKQALEQEVIEKLTPWKEIIFIVAGVGLLIGGASSLVRGAVDIAHHFGLSQRVIGITIVAIGSSFPEIATVIVAAIHRRTDLILGNIFGSNIYNVTMVVGIVALIAPINFSRRMFTVDGSVMLGLTALVFAMTYFCKTLKRWHGFMLLTFYALYLGICM